MGVPGIPLRLKIETHSHPEPNSGCWLWTGSVCKDGYGWVRDAFPRRMLRANRAAWLAFRGPIPDGMCVLHRCDTPACVNPVHLWLGTPADNNADKDAKGRLPRGDDSFARRHPERLCRGDNQLFRRHPELALKGEKNGTSKLRDVDVVAIRALLPTVSQRQLARQFGIDRAVIGRIAAGTAWKHIPLAAETKVPA